MSEPHPSSFRDPSGAVFTKNGVLYRHVAPSYVPILDQATACGLLPALQKEGLLVAHEEIERSEAGVTLRPEPLDFISYPYEWCFSQWKEAALLTLQLQKRALELGFTLKDASAFNVQFHRGRPLFIDTLSFEPYPAGAPWVAYRQFCEHFLAPLALMCHTDIRLGTLFRSSLQGIPLDLTSTLLPSKCRLNPHLLAHLYLHATSQKRWSEGQASPARPLSRNSLLGILDSLESGVRGLHWQPKGTEWGDYYDHTNYTDAALEAKRTLVAELLDRVSPAPRSVWDCGANTGHFSRVASERGCFTLAWDIDPAAVEQSWRHVREGGETHLLPLLQDLTNPSPALGWNLAERSSLCQRGPADVVFALALVHHLALSNNVPLPWVSAFFARLSRWLLIEFVPKEDSQVQRLLAHRIDIFPDYHQAGFEAAFSQHWSLRERRAIPGTSRTLFLFEGRA